MATSAKAQSHPAPLDPKGPGGIHPLRPLRYLGEAVNGTVRGFFDGMAKFGAKGTWFGLGLGIFAGIAMGTVIGTGLMFATYGLLGGAALGAAFGAIKGGYDKVSLAHRRDKYADEVVERQEARAAREVRTQEAPTRDPSSQGQWASRRQSINNQNFERQLQQERENMRDYDTYWQDRMENGRGHGWNKGF